MQETLDTSILVYKVLSNIVPVICIRWIKYKLGRRINLLQLESELATDVEQD
jgi:hypothetical protein